MKLGKQALRRSLLVAAAIAAGCSERPSAMYSTRAEAVAAGAFARGWLPSWIPEDASNIHEMHDLDTNEVCIRFDLPRDRRETVLRGMRALSRSEVDSLPKPCSLRPGWWDDGALDGDVFEAPGAPPHNSLVIAADRLGTAIHVWSR